MFVVQYREENVIILNPEEGKKYGDELVEWCEQHLIGPRRFCYTMSGDKEYPFQLWILLKKDMMIFKLRWM
jgi:hypothetical protein